MSQSAIGQISPKIVIWQVKYGILSQNAYLCLGISTLSGLYLIGIQ